MDDFINVFKKDFQVQIKVKDVLDKNIRFSCTYRSKIGYDSLLQNVVLEEIKNLMIIIIVGIDIELKLKISRLNYLESELSFLT